jgi:hypothetical protein
MAPSNKLVETLLRVAKETQRWMKENPEATAKILLWLEEGNRRQSSAEEVMAGRAIVDLFIPSNWRSLRIGVVNRAQLLMVETGICLAWVPGPDVIEALLRASNKEERDETLLTHTDSIVTAVEDVLAEVGHPGLTELTQGVLEAVAALDSGLPMASQAMSAAVITSVLQDHYGFKKFDEARAFFDNEHPGVASMWSSRRALVQWALRHAILGPHQRPADGSFSRHLTAHTVTSAQYTKANALGALLLAAGAVREMQEIYWVGKSGFAATPYLQQLTAASA